MNYTALSEIERQNLNKLLDDMTVTFKVHSYDPLFEHEKGGRFRVGKGIRSTLCLVTNVARAAHETCKHRRERRKNAKHLLGYLSKYHDT